MFSKTIKRAIRSGMRGIGYDVIRMDKFDTRDAEFPYREGKEVGPVNLSEKLARAKNGGPFEWPNIIALNEAAKNLIGNEQRIAELGCGTGKFISVAEKYPDRQFFASEFDKDALNWARDKYSGISNISWFDGPFPDELGKFDLLVALEIVEHIVDYVNFLLLIANRSDRAIISTPNRARSSETMHAGPPSYEQHIREWTAGEFYWVLRCFWDDVRMFSTQDELSSSLVKVDVNSRSYHLIADCRSPRL